MYTQNQGYAGQPGYGYPPQQADQGYPPHQAGYPPQPGGFQPYGGQAVPPAAPANQSGGGFFGSDPVGLFAEKAIRQAFISKVYAILTIQLVFTSILIAMFVLNEGTKKYFAASQGWMFLGFGIFMVAFFVLVCVESARRSTPCNMILLTILTFGYGLEAAIISCRYDTQTVMYAFAATGFSCFLIFMFAKTTSFDLTNCGTTLCLISLAHMVIGMLLIAIVGPHNANVTSLVISISGAALASLYLVFDLQLIMGGRKCELSPEEYILAAVMLYIDIMQIFLYLLEIISRVTGDK